MISKKLFATTLLIATGFEFSACSNLVPRPKCTWHLWHYDQAGTRFTSSDDPRGQVPVTDPFANSMVCLPKDDLQNLVSCGN